MSRVHPSFTLEGLRRRLDQMERDIADLHRRGQWRYDADIEFPVAATFSARAELLGSQNVPSATHTKIIFDSEAHDNADMIDLASASDRITITRSGYYVVTAEITFSTNTAGVYRQVTITKNGTWPSTGTLLSAPGVPPFNSQVHVLTNTQVQLSVGDYLTLGAWQDSGATLAVGEAYGETSITVTMLGELV